MVWLFYFIKLNDYVILHLILVSNANFDRYKYYEKANSERSFRFLKSLYWVTWLEQWMILEIYSLYSSLSNRSRYPSSWIDALIPA